MTRNQARVVVYGGLLLAAAGAVVAWWALYGGLAEAGRYDRGENGAWMRRHWIHGGAADPAALAPALKELGITRIYPFLGPMDPEGWPGWRDGDQIRRYDPETAERFFAAMEQAAPGVAVIPWTGGVLDRDVHLQDEALRAAFAGRMKAIVDLGADGVQLNVEPMPSDAPGYLELLRAVKAAIGPDKILSVAAYPPETSLHPYPDVHWTLAFTREVCLVADELAVMGYDTGLPIQRTYQGLVARWTRELMETLPPPEEGGCTWLMGVPAYEDDEPWHRPDVETLENGLIGVRRGLEGIEVRDNFRGVAVYASWTTDAAEWAIYDRLWRGREPSGRVLAELPGG